MSEETYNTHTLPAITERVCKAKGEIEKVSRNAYNSFAKYNYASVDDVYDEVRGKLAEHQLDIIMTENKIEIQRDDKRTPYLFATYKIGFVGEEPQIRSCSMPFTGAQTFEAAVSYVQKQWLRQRFQIPTGERDVDAEEWKHEDKNTATPPGGKQQPQKQAPKKQATPPKQQESRPPATQNVEDKSNLLRSAMHNLSQCEDKVSFDYLWGKEYRVWKEKFTEEQYKQLYDHAKYLKSVYKREEDKIEEELDKAEAASSGQK